VAKRDTGKKKEKDSTKDPYSQINKKLSCMIIILGRG
jgi:hypothetical protein